MKCAALAIFATVLLAQGAGEHLVTGVRVWPSDGATRVAIEVSGSFEYKYDRLSEPPRVYFDIRGARPMVNGKRVWSREVNDELVRRIRVAETKPGVTRVVMDVRREVEVVPSQLTSPDRLMIEVRAVAAPAAAPHVDSPPAVTPPVTPAPPAAAMAAPKADAGRGESPAPKTQPLRAETARPVPPAAADAPKADAPRDPRPSVPAAAAEAIAGKAESGEDDSARAARHTSSGGNSLTRALGLKLNRIVLDAGHGGHDQGTSGPKGLLEKDLVLDVTLRLGKLIEDGLGAEVIYTRSDDTFVPLETRTAIANEKKADLFLSIHANSSPVARITGVETYYLNFTDSKETMDLAARENAASHRSIFELQDLLQKITLHEKLDESREFASRVQAAIYAFSSRSFPGQKNRGVKKAPFVVLIGAQMPSILAEIGFVTNPREEQLLKKPDYRQHLAEALYRGVARYAESLSHFQVARSQ
ncbi:MAG: N-acetylmuramoyl-L-alanine amidase [Acidobacteriota bacterium]|nr:N-acetylmuramoyl-L-alanine amidase [Acidobacteriota bacterium]